MGIWSLLIFSLKLSLVASNSGMLKFSIKFSSYLHQSFNVWSVNQWTIESLFLLIANGPTTFQLYLHISCCCLYRETFYLQNEFVFVFFSLLYFLFQFTCKAYFFCIFFDNVDRNIWGGRNNLWIDELKSILFLVTTILTFCTYLIFNGLQKKIKCCCLNTASWLTIMHWSRKKK